MTVEEPTVDEPADDTPSDLDKALEALLVDPSRVKIDPATGKVVSPDGEKSPLTDPQDPNTIG